MVAGKVGKLKMERNWGDDDKWEIKKKRIKEIVEREWRVKLWKERNKENREKNERDQ
jgi:hypothetical protein